jgi:osmotically-inducible protein OsmY
MSTSRRSYDDITRATVIEPDSSWRPTREQVQHAFEGQRALDADEHALLARIHMALGADADLLEVEIDRACVILRGRVPTSYQYRHLEDVVRAVVGVEEVKNDLVIGR